MKKRIMNKELRIKNKKESIIHNSLFVIHDSGPKGFTFIELLLYISVVTILLSALIPFAWNVIEGQVKVATEQEVYSQARYVAERIKQEIRNANSINSVAAASIDLNTTNNTTTVIDLSGSKARIKYGVAGVPVNLNSDDTNISALSFTNYTSGDAKTKHIGFTFTINNNSSSIRQEYQETLDIRSSAEIRSN